MTLPHAFPHFRARQLWLVLLVLGTATVGLAPSADGDVWWHLAAGREMVARGQLLTQDPFSVSAAGRPWVDVHWLFQLGVYFVHSAWGLAGLVWVKCAVISLGAALLLAALERDRFAVWARPLLVSLLVTALLVSRQLLLVRPVIISLLCVAIFFYQLERFRLDGKPRRLGLLALVQVLWANCQGLSPLGPAMLAAYALATGLDAWLGRRPAWPFARELSVETAAGLRRFKLLSLGALACALSVGLTPFGARGFALPATLLGRLVPGEHNVYAHTVAENVPPFLLERWSGGEFWHLKWFFLTLALLLVVGGRRLRASHALLLLGFASLALLGNRNVLLLYWMATPIAALQAAPALRRLSRLGPARVGARVLLGANLAILAGVLGVAGVAAARESRLSEPTPFRAPAGSARLLAASADSGDVFCADHHGGYLIWQLYPRFRPYIDTRLVLRTPAEFAEYLSLADEPERFDAFQQRHGFRYVVLPVAYPDRYLGLIRHLYRSAEWRLLYTNGSEVLFARREQLSQESIDLSRSAATDRILAELERDLAGAPRLRGVARQHLATLDIAVGETTQAERVLSDMPGPEATALLARARFAAGDLDSAKSIAAGQLARDSRDVRSLSLLAQVALVQGELPSAAGLLRRALRVDPFDGEAMRLLASLEDSKP